MTKDVVSVPMPPVPAGKPGLWYPRILGRRWHFYLAGETSAVCGKPFLPFKLAGRELHPAEFNPDTVPFRDKCSQCERRLTVALGSRPL